MSATLHTPEVQPSAARSTGVSPAISAATGPSRRGLLIVMTGASGVGKGTLREKWLKDQNVFYSMSWTTREARSGERPGIDYHFVSAEQFEAHAQAGGFLEHAEFVGNRYGTPRGPIDEALSRGQDVILEIEVLGAMQVAAQSEEAVLIFIMPPSLGELRRRLEGRATETPERIEKRLARAREEILEARHFRYVVVNDDLDRAVDDLCAIQRAERLKAERLSDNVLQSIASE
ncbi:guanylate kinase [Deinococcus irradiatisoli]|uniref:Guanylate kinase n=1 Tax=Deinococcus irradiatisoli TaxID=2202254 RepID=A0A2Z3JCQ4_9DEIO|nr:guanylate kinase [Deinococcus irradiatisoli]AWN21826.1 guanylate kinase [Deinococcus irradiatisoli]